MSRNRVEPILAGSPAGAQRLSTGGAAVLAGSAARDEADTGR